jgi:uncharacterized protein YwqG
MNLTTDLLQQVQVTPELSLSKALTVHWSEIEKSCLESIYIEAAPTADLRIEQSKFGGYPWLPEDPAYPLDYEGNVGVANFFIHLENLKKRNFSNVLYNRDCS